MLTHIVNPHHFYFKYVNDCINSEYSKFDYEMQLYGNQLHTEKSFEKGYSPTENELVIFFNAIFNKWIRGRVISVDQEITLWCIDNGYVFCKLKTKRIKVMIYFLEYWINLQ